MMMMLSQDIEKEFNCRSEVKNCEKKFATFSLSEKHFTWFCKYWKFWEIEKEERDEGQFSFFLNSWEKKLSKKKMALDNRHKMDARNMTKVEIRKSELLEMIVTIVKKQLWFM